MQGYEDCRSMAPQVMIRGGIGGTRWEAACMAELLKAKDLKSVYLSILFSLIIS